VLAEPLQAGAAAGVDELVVVHERIITETEAPRPAYRAEDEVMTPRTLEGGPLMRRIPIALILILAGLLSACTNPSSGGAAATAAPVPVPVASGAAPSAQPPDPGY
jgi:hypothetical protein